MGLWWSFCVWPIFIIVFSFQGRVLGHAGVLVLYGVLFWILNVVGELFHDSGTHLFFGKGLKSVNLCFLTISIHISMHFFHIDACCYHISFFSNAQLDLVWIFYLYTRLSGILKHLCRHYFIFGNGFEMVILYLSYFSLPGICRGKWLTWCELSGTCRGPRVVWDLFLASLFSNWLECRG